MNAGAVNGEFVRTAGSSFRPGRAGRAERVVVVVLLALHAILAFGQRAPSVTTGQDDAQYLLLAREVAGGSYRDRHLPGAPLHRQYPPGYPALLAAGSVVVGSEPPRLALIGIACSVAALLVIYLAARTLVPASVSIGTLALASVNPFLVSQAGRIASESLFMLFVALALALLAPPAARGTRSWLPTLGAALTRSAGAPLTGALLLHELLARRWRAAALALVLAVAPAAAWVAFSLSAPEETVASSYASDVQRLSATPVSVQGEAAETALASTARRAVLNAILYLRANVPTMLPVPVLSGSRADNVVWLVAIVAFVGTGLYWLRRRWTALPLFLGCYAALLVIWPWTVGRFALPVLPQLLLLFLLGAWQLASRVTTRPLLLWLVPVVLVGGTAIGSTIGFSRLAARCDRSAPYVSAGCFSQAQRDLFAAAEVLAADSAGGRVLTAKSAAIAYLSGRPVLPATSFLDLPEALVEEVGDRLGVRAVFIGYLHETDHEMATRLLPHCRRLRVSQRFPGGAHLYSLGSTDDAPGAPACPVLEARVTEGSKVHPIGFW